MKRIISACIEQTIRFDTFNEANPQKDFEQYLLKMDKKRTKYEVLGTEKDEDGSLIIKVKKDYNGYSTEGYLK